MGRAFDSNILEHIFIERMRGACPRATRLEASDPESSPSSPGTSRRGPRRTERMSRTLNAATWASDLKDRSPLILFANAIDPTGRECSGRGFKNFPFVHAKEVFVRSIFLPAGDPADVPHDFVGNRNTDVLPFPLHT